MCGTVRVLGRRRGLCVKSGSAEVRDAGVLTGNRGEILQDVSHFLPARRYASAGNSDRNVSVCPSVCLSVRHAPVLCKNEES